MALLLRLKDNLLIILGAALAVAYGIIRMQAKKNDELEEVVEHYEIKEEADDFRAEPVVRDKSAILDRL